MGLSKDDSQPMTDSGIIKKKEKKNMPFQGSIDK